MIAAYVAVMVHAPAMRMARTLAGTANDALVILSAWTSSVMIMKVVQIVPWS